MLKHRYHICFVAPSAYPILADDTSIAFAGGAELQQVIIARGLARRGYKVSIISLDFGQEDVVSIDGITVYKTYRQGAGIPVLRFFWPRLVTIWKAMKRASADIYYQRAASMLTGVLAAFCRLHGRKSIFAIAGDPMIRFGRDRWIYEYGIRNVDKIVVQNDLQKQLVQEEFGRNSVFVPSCYEPPATNVSLPDQYVLWVSTIRQIKRPDLFLDLARSLPNHQFVMIGGAGKGEASLFADILGRAKTMENVSFVGYVPYSEIGEFFDNALVFVNTSDSEGFPNTFLQSWARAVPTISYIDCGARIGDQPVGRVVESAVDMAKAVEEMLLDKEIRQQLGRLCQTYVEENHHLERVLDIYERIFDETMGAGELQ